MVRMPGLLVCSWDEDHTQKASLLFDEARTAYERLKGLECNSDVEGKNYRIARFSGGKSPYPDVLHSKNKRIVTAAAGWWFDADNEHSDLSTVTEELAAAGSQQQRILNRMQGQYLAVAIDAGNGKIFACGDQLGLFPIYSAIEPGIAWIATSSLALACALGSRLNTNALRALFMGDSIRSPNSAFEGIKRIALGEQCTLSNGSLESHPSWTPFLKSASYRSMKDAVDEGIHILGSSCRNVQKIWPDCVADLTGGFDSRLVIAMMADPARPFHVTVNGDPSNIDVVLAHKISDEFNWTLHHYQPPDGWGEERLEHFKKGIALIDGEKPGHQIDNTIWAKNNLIEFYDAATGGSGGELYREFFWQQEYFKIGRTCELNIDRLLRYRFTFSSKPDMKLFRSDWRSEYLNSQRKAVQRIVAMAPDALNTAKLDAIYIWKASGHSGRYQGASFPVIASPLPLLTGNAVEYAISLPWKYRMGGKLVRRLITQAHPKLASMPSWYGGSAEPLSLRRPVQLSHYYHNLFLKFTRKMGQLAFKSALFRSPTVRVETQSSEREFTRILEREGLLDINNLITKDLYNVDYLKNFLGNASREEFNAFEQLYAITSIEMLCRMCGISPDDQTV
jgi:hypothetical protein